MEGKIKDLQSEIENIANVLNKGLPDTWSAQHPGTKIPKYEIKLQLDSGYPHIEAIIGEEKCEIEPGITHGSVWLYCQRKPEVGACLSKSGYSVMN